MEPSNGRSQVLMLLIFQLLTVSASCWCEQYRNSTLQVHWSTFLVGISNTVNGVGITVFQRESDCHSDSEASGKWTMTQIPVVGLSLIHI